MLSSKKYIQRLLLIMSITYISLIGYTLQDNNSDVISYENNVSFDSQYPLPYTNRISFDAKIKFVREHIDVSSIDTLIVGSSIGLNNIQGAYLEKVSKKCHKVLNFSVYESSALQVEQVLELIDAFPHLKRVIYSAQFSDFSHASKFKDYHPKVISKYLSHTLNAIEEAKFIFNASKNIPFLLKREKEWKEKHGQNNKFTYLGFDHTGSVPLHIYGDDIIKRRWNEPHAPVQNAKAFKALTRIIKKVRKIGVEFYLIQQPYRQKLIDKDPILVYFMKKFPLNLNVLVSKAGGKFFSLHQRLHLGDEYFADRSHLNDKGSIITAKEIAKIIDKVE